MNHGGNIYKYNNPNILDFSANINPLGVPEQLKKIICSQLDCLVNYPDPDYRALRKKISSYANVKDVFVGNGETEIIFVLLQTLKPKKILLPVPTFSEYENAAQRYRIDVQHFYLKEDNRFKFTADDITSDVDCVILCNPNNPTSTLIDADNMKKIVEHCANHNISLIIDEAFIELTVGMEKNSMAGLVEQYPKLFIMRSFTKVFAVPGLRLGYCIANQDFIDLMDNNKLFWSVNSLACCIGDFLPVCGEYIQATRNWLVQSKLYDSLLSISRLKVFKPDTNFILLKILDDTNCNYIKKQLLEHNILIREADNFKGLNDKYFRVAIKDDHSNDILVDWLKKIR